MFFSKRLKEYNNRPAEPAPSGGDHLDLARESLRQLLADQRLPGEVRESLAGDFEQVQAMLDKLEHGHLHIAVIGRVSVGKSATLNALLGAQHFRTSPLHGETRRAQMAAWDEYDAGGVFLIDTPGLNEVAGEDRERMAHEVAARADLVIFVVDGDLTDTEFQALRTVLAQQRPVLLVLNKCDRLRVDEQQTLREALVRRVGGLIDPANIVLASAQPAPMTYVMIDEQGNETETRREPPPDVAALRTRLWEICEAEGMTLAALNASLFAGDLSEKVAARILEVKRDLGRRVIRTYCISKGVAVGFNPIPAADLAAAALVDVSMIGNLSQLYGLPLTKIEAGRLVATIVGQIALVMGTVWAVHLLSSALKAASGGLTTAVTAAAQGAVAYYSTLVVGRATERYLQQGKAWGEGGPKRVVREILESLDRDSVLASARADIQARLRASRA